MSSSCAGGEEWTPCTLAAGYLAMHVYTDPPRPPSDPNTPGAYLSYIDEKIAAVEENWEEWPPDEDLQSSSGLVGRLFKLKSWDETSSDEVACPPCLAYRGTDFEDMRDLAISVRISLYGISAFSKVLIMDRGLQGQMGDSPSHEAMVNAGFLDQVVFDDSGFCWVEGATAGVRAPFRVNVRLSILARRDGDWASNVLQGLGHGSRQYAQAIDYGRRVVRDKIRRLAEKRLRITGHSLGGGLAAATATVLDSENPTVQFHCVTFNAAGVHRNTVRPASLGGATVLNVTVADEILTTVQSYATSIPLVGPIFRMAAASLGQVGMPEAVGNLMTLPGRAPPGSPHAQAGQQLPDLFPMFGSGVPSRHHGRYRRLEEIHNLLAGATNVTDFGNALLEWLNENYRDEAIRTVDRTLGLYTIFALYGEMMRHMQRDTEQEMEGLGSTILSAVDYHGMAYVIATTEAAFPAVR